jgi:hypothetical protein
VPAGKYQVSVALPAGYSSLFNLEATTRELQVTRAGCSAEVDLAVQLDGRVSGRLIGVGGEPAKDVRVSLVTVESATKGVALAETRIAFADKNSRFELEGLLPGRYVLGVGIWKDWASNETRVPPTYFPGTRSLADATVIELGKGQKIGNLEIRVPERRP